jgi:regulator of protease activity HflC (stomatin/prohibitin superfamily)
MKLLLPMILLSNVACIPFVDRVMVPAGSVGVKVNLYGESKGVSEEVLPVGKYWIGMNEELYIFPVSLVNYVWSNSVEEGKPIDESIGFQTKEGLSVGVNVGITFSIIPEKAATVFQKYRKGITEITDIYIRNIVRDAFVNNASTMGVEDIYGSGKKLFVENVTKEVKAAVLPIGINVEKVYLVGEFRLPPAIVETINAKLQATQNALKIENEVRTSRAEAEKAIVTAEASAKVVLLAAEGQAKANRLLSESLTPSYIEYIKIQKWNGALSQVSGSNTPIINLGK